ncbi:hypothetical protein DFJ73DRAFT_620890 [Zopfochytrium polystomum]|nr:hypothetical protein DFJ73DRAFT_620890 [Zopfochytrium polystomum]
MFSAAAAAKSVASSSGHATRASSNTTALQLNNALPEDGRSTKNASSESESLSDVTDPDQELLFHRAFDSAKSAEVQLVLTQCEAVDFDVFKLGEVTNGRPLYFLSMHLLRKYGLIEHFRMSENTCANFFRTVESSYRKLSYHNSFHAADVLQTVTLLLLSDADMVSKFTKLEVLAACIASAVHDVDHPGVNNNYLVQSSHPLAIVYNDLSVLEFHHSRKAFEIARRPDCDVFSCLSLDARKDVRRLIIGMVLATDTTSHFTYINKLKSKISASSLNLDDSDDRALVLDMAIKCADLNNPTKTTNQCKNWAYRVMEEFFKQGDKERLMGLPVSKFMDRNDTNIPKCQLGFIDIMVRPLFDAWSQCIRTDFTTTCMANIAKNRAYWESIHNKPEEIPEIPSLSLEELSADPFSSGIRIHQYRLPRFSRDGAEVLVRVGDKKIGDGKAGKLQARKVAGVSAMMGKSLNRRLSMMATTSDGGSRRMSTGRRMTLTPKSPLSRSGSQKDQQTATLTVEPKADGNNLPPLPRVLM